MILKNITQREDAYIRQVTSELYGTSPISWQYVGKLVPLGPAITGTNCGIATTVKLRINYNVDPSTFAQSSWVSINTIGTLTFTGSPYTDFYSFVTQGGYMEYKVLQVTTWVTVKMKAVFTSLTSWHLDFEMHSTTGNFSSAVVAFKTGGSMTAATFSGSSLMEQIKVNKLYVGTVNGGYNTTNYPINTILYSVRLQDYFIGHNAPDKGTITAFNMLTSTVEPATLTPKYAWFNGYEIETGKIENKITCVGSTPSISFNTTLA